MNHSPHTAPVVLMSDAFHAGVNHSGSLKEPGTGGVSLSLVSGCLISEELRIFAEL